MAEPTTGLPTGLRRLLASWATLWDTPGLEDDLTVAFSARLTRSLGRCRPATGRITLRAELRGGPPERLAEVLCHEAAHVAVFQKHGREARPHGPEWRALVAAAGFEPRTGARGESTSAAMEATDESPTPRRLAYEHRCPVCHTVRLARRPVPRWRCAECLDAGLDGEMIITRRADG